MIDFSKVRKQRLSENMVIKGEEFSFFSTTPRRTFGSMREPMAKGLETSRSALRLSSLYIIPMMVKEYPHTQAMNNLGNMAIAATSKTIG